MMEVRARVLLPHGHRGYVRFGDLSTLIADAVCEVEEGEDDFTYVDVFRNGQYFHQVHGPFGGQPLEYKITSNAEIEVLEALRLALPDSAEPAVTVGKPQELVLRTQSARQLEYEQRYAVVQSEIDWALFEARHDGQIEPLLEASKTHHPVAVGQNLLDSRIAVSDLRAWGAKVGLVFVNRTADDDSDLPLGDFEVDESAAASALQGRLTLRLGANRTNLTLAETVAATAQAWHPALRWDDVASSVVLIMTRKQHRLQLMRAIEHGDLTPRTPQTGTPPHGAASGYPDEVSDTWLLSLADIRKFCDALGVEVIIENDAPAEPTGMPTTPTASAIANQRPEQAMQAQEAAILAKLIEMGYEPLALPRTAPGRPGVKKLVRTAIGKTPLIQSPTVFDKAWQRLRGDRRIVEA